MGELTDASVDAALDQLIIHQHHIAALEAAIDDMKMGCLLQVLRLRLGLNYNVTRCRWEVLLPGNPVPFNYASLDAAVAVAVSWIASNGKVLDATPPDLSPIRVLQENAPHQARSASGGDA